MVRYVATRFAFVAVMLWVQTLLIFGITQVLPGNVAQIVLGQYQDPQAIATVERQLGLNRSAADQYFTWLGGLLHGDFGMSLSMDQPIGPLIGERLVNSLSLAIPALICVAVVGIALGVYGAVRENRWGDHATAITTFIGISIPEFFWGILLILLFAGYMHLLPSTGFVPITEDPADWARHIILPVATLTITFVAHVAQQTRSSMIEVLHSNYVRAARARGIIERAVVSRHALRNALLPTITVLALDFGLLLGSLVVVETVFAYPGLGRLTIYAVGQRDLPLIQACILVLAFGLALANLIADLLYAYLNPKIRYRTDG